MLIGGWFFIEINGVSYVIFTNEKYSVKFPNVEQESLYSKKKKHKLTN